jgi:hypothetical protein
MRASALALVVAKRTAATDALKLRALHTWQRQTAAARHAVALSRAEQRTGDAARLQAAFLRWRFGAFATREKTSLLTALHAARREAQAANRLSDARQSQWLATLMLIGAFRRWRAAAAHQIGLRSRLDHYLRATRMTTLAQALRRWRVLTAQRVFLIRREDYFTANAYDDTANALLPTSLCAPLIILLMSVLCVWVADGVAHWFGVSGNGASRPVGTGGTAAPVP